MSRTSQQGYVLLAVMIMLIVVAASALLVSYESSFNASQPVSAMDAARADYVVESALQHALWQNNNNACTGDFSIPTTALGQDSYSVTATGGGSSSTVSLSVDQDGWIKSNDAGKNNGIDVNIHVQFELGTTEQALYRFDLSSLAPGAQINSAVARFYLIGGQQHPEGPITVHRVTSDWTELGATWNTMNGNFESAVIDTIPAQAVGGVWVEINLTAQVQAWVNGEPNFGILLNSEAEGVHGQYATREDGSNPPSLDVTIGTSPVSTLNIAATGVLASGVSRTLTGVDVPAYKTPAAIVLQPGSTDGVDAYIWDFSENTNYGTVDESWIATGNNNISVSLLKFELDAVPAGVRVASATLSVYHRSGFDSNVPVTAHRITTPWDEDFVTYRRPVSGVFWTTEGGDYEESAFATTAVGPASSVRYEWDIAKLVEGWLNGTYPNYGVALRTVEPGIFGERFDTSDHSDASRHPRLTIEYVCECGTACLVPQGAGSVLLVVDQPTNLDAAETYKKSLIESWGYLVALIDDDDDQGTFDAAMANNDVAYVSATVTGMNVDNKLTSTNKGVVNEEGNLNDELGIASGKANPVGSSITIVDNSHDITLIFPAGALQIFAAGMEGLTVSGAEAPGLQTLADWGSAGSLVVVEQAASLEGGGLAAGRRVMLPLGRSLESDFNWKYLNNNGRLIVQRSIEWAMGPKALPGATALLLVVDDDTSLTDQELIKKVMIESWGYPVSIIDAEDSQADFDAAMADNDVVFVTKDVSSGDVNTKLTAATIGVVSEEVGLTQELGFSDGYSMASGTELEIDNEYFVTLPLSSGQVAVLSTSQYMAYLTGNIAPQIQVLGESGSGFALVALEAGAQSTIGPVAGRRVLLPWTDSGMDIDQLSADGLTIFQRALEWAGDLGSTGTDSYVLSTDNNAILGGLSFTDRDLTMYEPWTDTATLFFDGSLTSLDVDIDALHVLANGNLLLSPKGAATLGGISFEDGDLVEYDIATDTATLIFDGSALFADPTEKLTSVHLLGNGHLIISTDSNATLGGLSFTDKDLAEYDPANDTASLFFDGSLTTLNKKIAAVQVLDNGHIVLAPKKGGANLGGISFGTADLVDYDPITDTAELIFNGSALFAESNEKILSVHIGPGSGIGACNGTYLDEFDATSFSGDDGSLSWAADWLEVGESDGATSGDIQVANDESNYQLQTRDNNNGGEGVERQANLIGAVSATLTYEYRRDGLASASDYTSVDVSANGAAGPWTELTRHQGAATDGSYQPASHDISAYISANTRIRFKTSPTMGNTDTVWFDHIQIVCSP